MTLDDLFSRCEVDPNSGCWLWNRAVNGMGYGVVHMDGKARGAHRVMAEIKYGALISDQHVCHACDTPNCINPAHLWIGTAVENHHDAMRKGRAGNGPVRAERFGPPRTYRQKHTPARAAGEARKLQSGEHIQMNVKFKTKPDLDMFAVLRAEYPHLTDTGIVRMAVKELAGKANK